MGKLLIYYLFFGFWVYCMLVQILHREEFQQICVGKSIDTFGLVRKKFAILSAITNTEVQLNRLIWLQE